MTNELAIHAIYAVLNDEDLFAASVASIYDQVSAITVVTNFDRNWKGEPVEPTSVIEHCLDAKNDPEKKIQLAVVRESNEARARNRAMDMSAPLPSSGKVLRQHEYDRPPRQPDYFMIVDADEVYEPGTVESLVEYVVKDGGAPYYMVPGRPYFKYWNYPVSCLEWFVVLVRSDRRTGQRRRPWPTLTSRALSRLGQHGLAERALGIRRVPSQVATFHHGSYVGPASRLHQKVRNFSHSDEMTDNWVEAVWNNWSVERRNFHPLSPSLFPSATYVPTADLPLAIRKFPWPPGYLEPPTSD